MLKTLHNKINLPIIMIIAAITTSHHHGKIVEATIGSGHCKNPPFSSWQLEKAKVNFSQESGDVRPLLTPLSSSVQKAHGRVFSVKAARPLQKAFTRAGTLPACDNLPPGDNDNPRYYKVPNFL